VQACRRVARTIFLGSAPNTSSQGVRGLELERVILGAAQPGQQPNLFKDALRRLGDRLHYLNAASNRFWLDTRPNLRREMEERKRRFQDQEDVFPAIRERVQRSLASGVFGGIHVFTDSGDVPDDWLLRLVVLPPDTAFSKSGQSLAIERATEILRKRGDQPRFKQNRLIFVAADYDSVSRLKDHVRSYLAWRSIVADYKDNRIVLDNLMAKQAQASLDQADETMRRMIREAYKWLLAPMQEARPGKGVSDVAWEHFSLNPGAQNWSQEIERVLKENELLITEWAPIHLAKVLKDWFWKDDVKDASALNMWQQSCQQVYLPRLKDDAVFQSAMGAGAESREFFGVAQGKELDGGKVRYFGFSYGKRTSLMMDSSLLLIEPLAAAAYMESLREHGDASPAKPAAAGAGATTVGVTGDGRAPLHVNDSAKGGTPPAGRADSAKKQFYASIDLDPIQAKRQFADLADEVVQQFAVRPGVRVRIAVEIQAESTTGFDEGLQRAVKENCNVLKFKSAEFETGE
jgi:hypothetical protein